MMHLLQQQLFLLSLELLHQSHNLQAIHRQERFGRRNMAIGMIKTEQTMVLINLQSQGIEKKRR